MHLVIARDGGGFSIEPERPYWTGSCCSARGEARPGCFIATASGDPTQYVARFHAGFAEHDCHASHPALFSSQVSDLEAFVLDQDVIYVGGRDTSNLLAVWRVHGLDRTLRRAWQQGVLLCGRSLSMN